MEMSEYKLDKQMKAAYRRIREDLKDQDTGRCVDEETLIGYVEKRLDEPEMEALENHLSLCSKCNEYVIFMYRLNQLSILEEPPHPPKAVTKRAIALDRTGRQDPPMKALRDLIGSAIEWMGMQLNRFRPPALVLATAVAVGLVVVVVFSVKSPRREAPVRIPSFELKTRIVTRGDVFTDTAYSYSAKGAPKALPKRAIMDEKGGLLRSGDAFQIIIRADHESHLYAFIHDNRGKVTRLFPDPLLEDAKAITTDLEYVLPSEDKWLPLDEDATPETIYMMATSTPFQDPDTITRILRTDGIEKVKHDFGSIIVSTKSFEIAQVDDKPSRDE